MTRNPIVRLQQRIDTLEAEKVRLRKRVTELEAEVAEYELQLRSAGGAADEELLLQLVNFAKFTPKELKLLSILVSRKEGLSKQAIMNALYAHGYSDKEVPVIKIVDVFICKLRAKLRKNSTLPDETIETIWGRGYRIHTDHREDLKKLLRYPS